MNNCDNKESPIYRFFKKTILVYLSATFFIGFYIMYFDKLDTNQRRVSVPLLFFVFMVAILTLILPTR